MIPLGAPASSSSSTGTRFSIVSGRTSTPVSAHQHRLAPEPLSNHNNQFLSLPSLSFPHRDSLCSSAGQVASDSGIGVSPETLHLVHPVASGASTARLVSGGDSSTASGSSWVLGNVKTERVSVSSPSTSAVRRSSSFIQPTGMSSSGSLRHDSLCDEFSSATSAAATSPSCDPYLSIRSDAVFHNTPVSQIIHLLVALFFVCSVFSSFSSCS